MVSPGVIAGFAALDASVLGQLIYAVRSYDRHHHGEGPRDIPRGNQSADGRHRRSAR